MADYVSKYTGAEIDEAVGKALNGGTGSGANGVSPTVEVSKSGKVTTLTIKDAEGTKTATIKDGEDGTSVTVASVSESTADGGSNVVTFSDGKTLTVKNGSGGSGGATVTAENITSALGYTPANAQTVTELSEEIDAIGTQEEIVQAVITALGTPVFGRVDADNNIILTGNLANGQYAVKYENEDGSLTDVGMLTFSTVSYTNLADQDSTDWLTDKRINSSGVLTDATGVDITNYIALPTNAQKIHIKGLDIVSALPSGSNYGRVYAYDSGKTYTDYKSPSTLTTYFYAADYDESVLIVDIEAMRSSSSMNSVTGAAYLRFGGIPTSDEIIITIDENIQ